MKRRKLIKTLLGAAPVLLSHKIAGAEKMFSSSEVESIFCADDFNPTWDSLQNYTAPEWFNDAKFGIWAHWGPQCQPERGDWYARIMYREGSDIYNFHCQKYGHPSKFGFKDVINEWHAENWDPEELLSLYKAAGARYFIGMAHHHDNFDLFDSKFQSWNAVKIGPKKDLISGWAKAARNQGLPFGVSSHATRAWSFFEPAQLADRKGYYAGIHYDGRMNKDHGIGTWWEGFDPNELYEQQHALSIGSENEDMMAKQWDWGNGASVPSPVYCDKYYKRIIDLIDNYEPDLIYFDDINLPLYPISDVGLKIAAHFYNKSVSKHGKLNAVLFGKNLQGIQAKCMVLDMERSQSDQVRSTPWQTDTCIGGWHYDRRIFDNNQYKTAKTIIHTLVDTVSKNGNLLLNIPVRGDGTIDEKERAIVGEIGQWMKVNGEGIYGTRPWKVYGEGPAMELIAPVNKQGFNEYKTSPYSGSDYRFTTKGDILYCIALGMPPNSRAIIKSLKKGGKYYEKGLGSISLLGYEQPLNAVQTDLGLVIDLPNSLQEHIAYIFKISPL